MTAQNLAYLSRYGFVFLIVLAAILLFRASLKDFFGRIRYGRKAVPGFFLIAQNTENAAISGGIPLYRTTAIGSARSADLRIKGDDVADRHAVIYIYNDRWHIAPSAGRVELKINGVDINEDIPLEDQDVISIGRHRFIFINERRAAEDVGLEYREDIDNFGTLEPRQLRTGFAWLLINLYMIAGTGLIYVLENNNRTPYREGTLILMAIYIAVMNLFYLVLPLALPYIDRAILLAATQVIFIGAWLQLRFQALAWSQDSLDEERIQLVLGRIQGMQYLAILCLVFFLIVLLICARTSIPEKLLYPMMILVPLMLIASRLLGRGGDTHGASLWIRVGPLTIQLTEYVKIAYLIVLAGFFKNRPPLKRQILFACWAGLVFMLIMLLPDLGSIMVLLPTTLVVFFVMTSEYLITLGILVGGSGISVLVYSIFPHVQRRISGWATLWTEVTPANSQIVYGLQSISRGGLPGRGLGNGSPVGTPQYMDDMVFSPLCEDLGLLTGICVLLFFIIIWLRGTRMCMQVRDGFSSALILGLCTALFFEAAVVISGATGLIPLTGATLPFIAKGGSSLLAKYMMLGAILGLGARRDMGRKYREKLSA